MSTTLVTGTGNLTDAADLQNAVNTFDEVRLRGTFDFRGLESNIDPKPVITIRRNVRIRVERGENLTIPTDLSLRRSFAEEQEWRPKGRQPN